MKKLIFFVIILMAVFVGVFYFLPEMTGNKTKTVQGVPRPITVETGGQEIIEVDGKTVKLDKKYEYEARGIVRTLKTYNGNDLMDKVAPMDLGLVWGSAAQYNDEIDYRWFYEGRSVLWTVTCDEGLDYIDLDVVTSETEFGCLIPKDDYVHSQMKKLKVNNYIKIKGYLVDVSFQSEAGKTEITSERQGYHAIYVTGIEWLD